MGRIKRAFKDSVFTDLFSIQKYTFQLYQALHPDDKITKEEDITDVTIKNVLTDGEYNDLGFQVGSTTILLMEAQTKWSINIIIRILMYLMDTYNTYCTKNEIDLYSSKKAELPAPELYVLYTGDQKDIPESISLKDDFFDGKDVSVDAKVKVIRDGREGDIIQQYIAFTKVAKEQVQEFGLTEKAAKETVRICLDRKLLTEYLEERKVEVVDIMTALFDEEEVTRRYHLRVKNEGMAQGIAQGMAQGRAQEKLNLAKEAQELKEQGLSAEEILAKLLPTSK